MRYLDGQELLLERKYIGTVYEIESYNEEGFNLHYIMGGDGLAALYVTDKNSDEIGMYYPHTDHLGSILAMTDDAGNVVLEQSFDSWGRRREPGDWSEVAIAGGHGATYTPFWQGGSTFHRGFTGHEHIDQFGIINMNGRIYDPLLGRFYSPDPVILDPQSTQALNRYSYVNNNPLKYTDPSGEFLVPLLVGGVVSSVATGMLTDWDGEQMGWAFLRGAIIGTFAGVSSTMGSDAGIWANTKSVFGEAFCPDYLLSFDRIDAAVSSVISTSVPGVNIPITNGISISLGPSIFVNGPTSNVGISTGISVEMGNWTLGFGAGEQYISNDLITNSTFSVQRYSGMLSWDDGKTGFGYGTNVFEGGGMNQYVGSFWFRSGEFRARYENDGVLGPVGDNGDRWRTTAIALNIGDFQIRTQLGTGDPGLINRKANKDEQENGRLTYEEKGPVYRLGLLGLSYQGVGFSINNDRIRHGVQNRFAHDFLRGDLPGFFTGRKEEGDPWFKGVDIGTTVSFMAYTYNPFTLW